VCAPGKYGSACVRNVLVDLNKQCSNTNLDEDLQLTGDNLCSKHKEG